MGNSLGCSAYGERLVSAARDGDAVEAQMLLELSLALARYSTFDGLNTLLHFVAAKGHLDIVTLLLEKDCVDACLSAWTLGGGSDASTLQMQCMTFSNMDFHVSHSAYQVVHAWIVQQLSLSDMSSRMNQSDIFHEY